MPLKRVECSDNEGISEWVYSPREFQISTMNRERRRGYALSVVDWDIDSLCTGVYTEEEEERSVITS